MKKKGLLFSLIVFSLSLATACLGTEETTAVDGTGFAGSCDLTDGSGTCINYTGSKYTKTTVEAACDASDGTYSANKCSTDSSVGNCVLNSDSDSELDYVYYSSLFTSETGENTCDASSGEWTAAS